MLRVDLISVQPEMLAGFFAHSIVARAIEKGLCTVSVVDLKDFGLGRWRKTDDAPYGGGPGMLMRCEPWFAAVESCRAKIPAETPTRVVMTSPAGKTFTQRDAESFARLAAEEDLHLVFMCGHYEGFDARCETLATDFYSIGDFVMTGGEIAAAAMTDAIVRLLPGALGGGVAATASESFGAEGILETPQYTHPATFRGMKVPDVLLSGDHRKIEAWRRAEAQRRTEALRPDLLAARKGAR